MDERERISCVNAVYRTMQLVADLNTENSDVFNTIEGLRQRLGACSQGLHMAEMWTSKEAPAIKDMTHAVEDIIAFMYASADGVTQCDPMALKHKARNYMPAITMLRAGVVKTLRA